jgi:hypothetical protein
MSSFLKQGKRIAARKKKKEVKHHTKEFYKILGELDRVANILEEDQKFMKEFDPSKLKEAAEALTDIEIGNLELFVLKGKLGMYESLQEDIDHAKQD